MQRGAWIATSLLLATQACDSGRAGDQLESHKAQLTTDWQSGTSGWADRNGQPPMLTRDTTSPSGDWVQQIERATAGGDYFSPLIDVVGGQPYCLQAKVKWESGAAPFIGIDRYGSGTELHLSWVIGPAYGDDLGPTTVISSTATGWQDLAKSFTMPADTTQVRLVDELWNGESKDGSPLAYFDGLSLNAGLCAYSAPYMQDWDSSNTSWADASGQGPVLVADATSPAGPTVQELSRATSGGDYASPLINVTAGQQYCLRASIRWVGGAAPFVGLQGYASGARQWESWLIGPYYSDALGITTTISWITTEWQSLSRPFTVPADTTQVRIIDELWDGSSKSGAPLAYFDGISLSSGTCSSIPYLQDWDTSHGFWTDDHGQPPTLADDPTSTAGSTVEQLWFVGGTYSSPPIDVVPGQAYCLQAKVKWAAGAAPFVGLRRYGGGTFLRDTWLIGTTYVDALGPTTALSTTTTSWQDAARPFVMPADTTQVRIIDELWQGGSKDSGYPLAFVDDIALRSGLCLPPHAAVPYLQDWETDTGSWTDRNWQFVALANDATSPAGATVQVLNRTSAGGDYLSPLLDVDPGRTYCLSTQVRWVGGAAPFVGIERYTGGVPIRVSWLIGTAYTDDLGPTTEVNPTEVGWQAVMRAFVMPADTTQVRITNELWADRSKGGASMAYFDGLNLSEGDCTGVVTNRPPSVEAGSDLALATPSAVRLHGHVEDDGLPDGSAVRVAWSQVSGPGGVSFADSTALSTELSIFRSGVYVIRLTATDGELTSSDDVTITVLRMEPADRVCRDGTRPTATTAGGFTDPEPATTGLEGDLVLRKELFGYPSYGVIDGAADLIYSGQDATWTFTLPTSIDRSRITGAFFRLAAVADDHDGEAIGEYVWSVWANDQVRIGFCQSNLQHGLPFGGVFGNWSILNFPVEISETNQITISNDHSGPAEDWIAVDWIELHLLISSGSENAAPAVYAGPDVSTDPGAVIQLHGQASDDGLPVGSALTLSWTKVSGPGSVTFENATQAAATATITVPGTYQLRLTASDGTLSSSDDVQVVIVARNLPPVVDLGDQRRLTHFPGHMVLTGTVSDDGLPVGSSLTYSWTGVYVPAQIYIASPTSLATEVYFAAMGSYVLRLTVSDGELSGSDEVMITVSNSGSSSNKAPSVFAGADSRAELGLPVRLFGTVSDDGLPEGNSVISGWSTVSGPGSVTFSAATQASTMAMMTGVGTYVLRLTATDGELSSSDDVTITVDPLNHAPRVEAGPNQVVTLPPGLATLSGSYQDDGLPGRSPISRWWLQESGPVQAQLTPVDPLQARVAFTVVGTYRFVYTVDDGELSSSDDVTVEVVPAQTSTPP